MLSEGCLMNNHRNLTQVSLSPLQYYVAGKWWCQFMISDGLGLLEQAM